MKREPSWISRQVALALHERLLSEHGGAAGIREAGLLDAALAAPVNRRAYADADVFVLAAAYAGAIARNHPFVDGNKRIALTLAGVFLELNGFRLEAPEQQASHATYALAAWKMSEREYALWLRRTSVRIGGKGRRRPPGSGATRKKK